MTDLRYWLALHLAPGIGPAAFAALLERFGEPAAAYAAAEGGGKGLADLSPTLRSALRAPSWDAVEEALAWAAEPGNRICTLADRDYPARLREIHDPPPVLYVRGDPAVLGQVQLAVVGSRSPTPPGAETAYAFARHLATAGLTITSGLALGVDAAAHRGALDGGGATIAVTGTGLDRVYPARHRDLAYMIAERGALISEYPLGTGATPGNFPRRNRIISGLALGTLVVEAGLASGSLITARLALEQGREVFAIPGSIHNPLARGCHRLIRDGAKLVETAEDVLEELRPLVTLASPRPRQPGPAAAALDRDLQRLLDQIGYDPVSIDALIQRSGLTPETVSSMLLLLEMQGILASAGGLYHRLTDKAWQ